MTLALVATPSPTPFAYGDIPLSLSLAPSGALHPNWATTDGGVFSDRHGEFVTFVSANHTQTVTITGRRVTWMGDGVGVGWSSVATTYLAGVGVFANLTKYAGSNTWANDAKAVGQSSANADETFYEFTTAETNKEKAGGLTTDATNSDPTNTVAPFLNFVWHLLDNSTAQARHNGVAVGTPVTFTTSDVFKVYKSDLIVYYMINEVVIESVAITAGTWNLYPVATFKDVGATMNSNVAFSDTGETKQGVLTFQLYGVFPESPNYTYEINADNRTLISYAEDGSATFRLKGGIKKSLSLQFNSRPFSEYVVVADFWEWHQKHLKFFYRDVVFDQTYFVVNDAGLKTQANGPDQISMALIVREV